MNILTKKYLGYTLIISIIPLILSACLSEIDVPLSQQAQTTVAMDFLHKPLPNIPLPNDIATRYDPNSATLKRINASMVAPTYLEKKIRTHVDQLDGWGVNQPITIPFTGLIDIAQVLRAHGDVDYKITNDLIYLIDITPSSPEFGQVKHLDIGNGNYPSSLEERGDEDDSAYGPNNPRAWTLSLLFEEANEDQNGNGVLDPKEDEDADLVLDLPNYLPCNVTRVNEHLNERLKNLQCDERTGMLMPEIQNLRGRADAFMSFYERETNTLIARPMVPLRERTTYAVVVSKALKDAKGNAIGSPFQGKYHTAQAPDMKNLEKVLPKHLRMDDIAFAFSYTTQSLQAHWIAVREGLYGHGIQKHIGEEFPAQLEEIYALKDTENFKFTDSKNPHLLFTEELRDIFNTILGAVGGNLDQDSYQFQALNESLDYVDYHVMGKIKVPQLFPRSYDDLDHDVESCETICQHRVRCRDDRAALTEVHIDTIDINECVAQCEGKQSEESQGWSDGQKRCYMSRCQAEFVCEDEIPMLDYVDQVWPNDLDRQKATTRSEEIVFWLTVPRKEVSSLKDDKAVPVVMVGHGYTLHRLDAMLGFGGQLAKQGNATLVIDCVSHGLVFPEDGIETVKNLGDLLGLKGLVEPLLTGRAIDWNRDGLADSGADFWTAYLFHTRDMVRQCALDYMQVIRVLRSFDGKRRWNFDLNGDGENELAGDFNADGVVDIGMDSSIGLTGTSLGGIMSGILAGLEPQVDVTVPIAGGGVLSDIGMRSLQSGVREAVIYRLLAPSIIGNLSNDQLDLSVILPDLNQPAEVSLGSLSKVSTWDTIVARNLSNQEIDCAYVLEDHTVHMNLASDLGDLWQVEAYRGQQPCLCIEDPQERCVLEPYDTLKQFTEDVEFQGVNYKKGQALEALAEGLGQARSTPRLRRFFHLSQLVLDAGDPATYARHWLMEPLVYPAVGDQTGTHTLLVTTMGDMNVPANSGLTLGRAAGLIDYLKIDDRYRNDPVFKNLTPNEILIRAQASEAIHTMSDFTNLQGELVHLDLENLSGSSDLWEASGQPRLTPPLRLGIEDESRLDQLGGKSGAIFPFIKPDGYHGFSFPGQELDILYDRCMDECEEGDEDLCEASCRGKMEQSFDLGNYMSGFLGGYMLSGGKRLDMRPCLAWGCEGIIPPAPAQRTRETLYQ